MRSRSWLTAFIVLTALLLFPMLERLAAQDSSGIVISEFRFRGINGPLSPPNPATAPGANGANDEFIELFNGGLAPVNVGGWQIRVSNNNLSPSVVTRVTIPDGTVINRGCYYLVTNVNTAGGYNNPLVPGDRTYTIGYADDGGVALTRADQTNIVDQVGHGANGAFGEGTRLPTLVNRANRGIERLHSATAGYVDSDNNAADFREILPGTPQNSHSPCLLPGELGISASASPSPVEQGETVTIAATITAATLPPSTNLHVTGDLSAIGGPASAVFADNGVFPDATSNDNIYTTAVTVPAAQAPGAKSLPLSVNDAQGRTSNTVVSLTINEPLVIYLPHDIQGAGATSPFPVGTAVIVRGVVTARKSDGFFMQTDSNVADADPNTSEGVFVSMGGGAPAEAQAGHLVQVRASVAEFVPANDLASPSRTELSLVTSVIDLGTSTMPAPYALTETELSAPGALDQLERFEGMRVTVASLTAITGTGAEQDEADAWTSDGVFYAVLTGQARPFRAAGVARGYPVLACQTGPCHVPIFDGNPERLRVDSDALEGTAAVELSTWAVMTDVSGPLDFAFRTYTLLPDATLSPVGGSAVTPAPGAATDQFTIASFNLGRFTLDQTRMTKASLAIRTVLKNPDVLGVQEIESPEMLEQLAARINSDALAAGGAAPGYTLVPFDGTANGLAGVLVSARVNVSSVEQVGTASVMLRVFLQGPATSLPQSMTVIVNHLRSLEDVGGNNAAGAAARAERRAQADLLATYIQDRQLNDPNEAIVSIGDYNAFGFNDGYVDTVGTILGTPTPEDRVALASADLVSPDLVNLADFMAESERYSSLDHGNAQVLEHALVSANLVAQFTGLVHPRVNADFAESLRDDAGTPERLSDRDPVVAYFSFPPDVEAPVFSFTPEDRPVEATSAAGAVVTYVAPKATDNLDGDVTVACEPSSGATQPLGYTGVTCTAADAAGNVASVSFTVTVRDTTAPALDVPADVTAEAASADGQIVIFTASATDAVTDPPMVSCAPASGTMFPLGATTVHCTASDAAGHSVEKSFTITVEDTTAPNLTMPANITTEAASAAGQLVDFTASATDAVTDPPMVSCAPASGTMFPLGATTVHCTASDAAGHSTEKSFTVTVEDTIAPQLTVPGNITAEAGSAAGQLVTFTASATDTVTDPPMVSCAPASGTMFPLGATTVHCTASDAAGHSTEKSFTVTVEDTIAPQLTVPGNITAEAGSAAGQLVTFTASATDAVTDPPMVSCAPASGTMFPLGPTTVHCTASDAAGHSVEKSFTVTVQDTTAPHLSVPDDIAEPASSPAGTVVTFTASATDAVSGSPVVTCAPASGSTFPIGITTVECSASDAAGHSVTESFTVTVTQIVAGRMNGIGSVGSLIARASFAFEVRATTGYEERGWLLMRAGSGYLVATVTDVVFANSPGFAPGPQPRSGADSVTFTGTGWWNSRPGYSFEVVATDQGEPGRGHDTFTVVVRAPNGVIVASAGGTLTSGNNQSLR